MILAAAWKQTPAENTPRLRLKPKAPITGYVDGGWWPHSDIHLTEWAEAPNRLSTGGRVVRRGGYYRQPVNTIQVLGVNRSKMARAASAAWRANAWWRVTSFL